MTIQTTEDILIGSSGATTTLSYNLDYRNFYYVSSGKITMKLIPPENSKYLNERKNYDNFEFCSNINPWNVSDKNISAFENVTHMDIVLFPGDIIFIPAYWWYSIKYEEFSHIYTIKHRTFMNGIAITPEILMYYLQNQNITYKISDTVKDIKINNSKANQISH